MRGKLPFYGAVRAVTCPRAGRRIGGDGTGRRAGARGRPGGGGFRGVGGRAGRCLLGSPPMRRSGQAAKLTGLDVAGLIGLACLLVTTVLACAGVVPRFLLYLAAGACGFLALYERIYRKRQRR